MRDFVGNPECAAHVLPQRTRRKVIPKVPLGLGVSRDDVFRPDVPETKAGKILGVSVKLTALATDPAARQIARVELAASAEQREGRRGLAGSQ